MSEKYQTNQPQAGGAASSASDRGTSASGAQRTAHEAREAASQAGQQAREQARQAKDKIVQRGREAADAQKEGAAAECEIFGAAVREAGRKLEEEGHPQVACYAEACAEQCDKTANYLRNRDYRGLYEDASEFARRRPELFLGGMFLAGMAISRLLKASSERANQPSSAEFDAVEGYDRPNPYSRVTPSEGAPLGAGQRMPYDEPAGSFESNGEMPVDYEREQPHTLPPR